MSTYIDLSAIRKELLNFLRSSDILTVTQRGVTTSNDTGTFDADETYVISKTNVKNIRSIVVAGTTLTYGEDYTVDFDYLDTTIKCKISFTAAQTGAYTISYNHGTDKIWDDFPRDDLTIGSYPRVSVDVTDGTSDAFGIGGTTFSSSINFTVVVYAQSIKTIDSTINTIRQKIMGNSKLFYYLGFTKPIGIGPLIENPEKDQEIMSRNIDFQSIINVEST